MDNKDYKDALQNNEFKDAKPLDTVNRIKEILKTYNIEVDEYWFESGVPYCYSLRVTVKGTTFGTNGKGLTKEFALASAYGELMERLQMGFLGNLEMQKNGYFKVNDGISKLVSAKDLFEKNKDWYQLLSARLKFFTNEEISAEKILMQYIEEDGMLLAAPFYCLNTESVEYYPTKLRKQVYTANGCAAGNTPEEAIVQAISEIVERNYLTEMMFNDFTPPDIPEEVLKKFTVSYSIITYLREHGFKVVVKDCSRGECFPVISVCIIDKQTGKYHTHFGANPIFEIALERALTESFQGRNINDISEIAGFRFAVKGVFDVQNLISELSVGVAEKLTGFFVGKPLYPYNEAMGFKGKTNKELLKECIGFFDKKGFDILIRDYSCLGFCTYQVLIPGYSEVFSHRLSTSNNDLHYQQIAIKTLRNISATTIEEQVGFLAGILRHDYGFVSDSKLHLTLSPREEAYYMSATLAYINYGLKKYQEVIKHIKIMLKAKQSKDDELLICIMRYISLLINKYSIEEIKDVLYYFHNKAKVDKLLGYVSENKNILDEFTLHCDLKCSDSCLLCDKCCNKRVSALDEMILAKTTEMDFDNTVKKMKAILS